MAKKLQLQIPIPCHENWENMTPGDTGRFCSSCQKKVIDFSNMSDREIALFFKKSSTRSVCGRFIEEQLNRDIEIPRKRIPWFKYFLQLAFPTFLVSCEARSQGKVKVLNKHEITATPESPQIKGNLISTTVLAGTAIIQGISLHPLKKFTKKHLQQKSTFLPQVKRPSISKEEFASLQNSFVDNSILLPQRWRESEISVKLVGAVAITCYRKKASNPRLLKTVLRDTLLNEFKIYPNPLPSNSTLHIEWKQKEFGDHVLELFNQSGQRVLSKEIYIDEEAKLLEVTLPPLSAGNYFLRLTGKSTGRSHAQKLVVN